MPKLLNKVNLPRYSSAPSTPSEADLYYNTSDDKIYVYTGAAWVEVGSGAGGSGVFYQSSEPSSPSNGDIWIDSDDEVASVTSVTDSTSTTSSTVAASATAVKAAYDLATTKAKVSVGTTAPVTPSTGDVWVDTAGTATAINAVPLAALTGTGAMIYGASAGTAATLAIGSTDQQLVVSGGVPAWATSPDIAKATLTTTGDIIYASGSATPARLGVGTTGQVLGVAAGVPAWTTPAGGGMTLIATATPSGASTISFTSIPTTYKHLMIVWQDVFQSSATGSDGWGVRLNNDTTAGLHTYFNRGFLQSSITGDKGSSTLFTSSSAEQRMIIPKTTSGSTTYADQARGVFMVYRYTESNEKFCEWRSSGDDALSFGNGRFGGTAAITQVDFVRASTQTITGKFYLYGVS
jgi:hypothetical protein